MRSTYILGYMMVEAMVLAVTLQEKGKDDLDIKQAPAFDLTARLVNTLVLQVSVFLTTHVWTVLGANGDLRCYPTPMCYNRPGVQCLHGSSSLYLC